MRAGVFIPWKSRRRAEALAMAVAGLVCGSFWSPAASAARIQAPGLGGYECTITNLGPPGVSGVPMVQIFPSVLGTVTLRRGGRYGVTLGPSRGRWRFAGGRVRFRGGLLARLRSRYYVKDGAFGVNFNYRGQTHYCVHRSRQARAPRYKRPNGAWTGRLLLSTGTTLSFNLGDVFAVSVARGSSRRLFQGTQQRANLSGRVAGVNKGNDVVVTGRDGRLIARLNYGDELSSSLRLWPAISPDGRLVAHEAEYVDMDFRTHYGVVVRGLDGSQRAFLEGLTQASFARDGTLVAAGGRASSAGDELSGLWSSSPPYSRAAPLRGQRGLGEAEQPVVSPDNRRIAFTIGSALWIARRDGSGARKLAAGAQYAWPAFSPDSKGIAVQRPGVTDYETVIISLTRKRRSVVVGDNTRDAYRTPGRVSWSR